MRRWFTAESTTGELCGPDGARWCFVLEDVVRAAKVPGRTAIPAGRYQVGITFSPRFKRRMPLLLDVPGFSGVRIHPGNTAADTEGCLLVGAERGENCVRRSREAYAALLAQLQQWLKREPVTLLIESASAPTEG